MKGWSPIPESNLLARAVCITQDSGRGGCSLIAYKTRRRFTSPGRLRCKATTVARPVADSPSTWVKSFVPRELAFPGLLTRVEQRHLLPGDWIGRSY
jgi:hypothetical protein